MTKLSGHGWLALLGAMLLLATACGGGGGDRNEAVANLKDILGVDDAAANCIVDEFGEDRLGDVGNFARDSGGSSDDAQQLTSAVAACMTQGATDGPGIVATDEPVDCSSVDGACDYGDDPELDALWDRCADGDGKACDDLYYQSDFGTRYEQFGNTCGDRGFEMSCADVYD